MGVAVPHFTSVKPVHLAEILEKTKGMKLAPVVNNMVLRSMAKAKYSDEPVGHFGLVLADYSHFTSPIRRYLLTLQFTVFLLTFATTSCLFRPCRKGMQLLQRTHLCSHHCVSLLQ
jgi:hypothetical protein